MSDTASSQLFALASALYTLEQRHTREIAVIHPMVDDEVLAS